MLFRHLYHDGLAQASYLLGCQATGEAIVVDPNRDVERYLRLAAAEGVRITAVTETHIHADFVSGARELAQCTGARLYLSDHGGPEPAYRYAAAAGATLIRDGDRIEVGKVRLDVMHAPGHTPEHLAFLVTDTATSPEPMGILTGDLLFVGEVGRPDLLESAVGVSGAADAGARDLFRSLARLRTLPDWLQVWPGHGAGSACGRSLGAVPQTTIGYEKRVNWALARHHDEDGFVRAVLAGQPEPPRYFAVMKRLNRDGPPILGGFTLPSRLHASSLPRLIDLGALVVDLRKSRDFIARHVPRTISIAFNRSFTTWAGWLVPFDREFYLLTGDPRAEDIEPAVRELRMIGLDRIAGYFGPDALDHWERSGRPAAQVEQLSPREFAQRRDGDGLTLVDVRNRAEWDGGHLPGAIHIPLGYLMDRVEELPKDRPLVVQCQTGSRSVIGASLLQSLGYSRVLNLTGGLEAWNAEGLPLMVG